MHDPLLHKIIDLFQGRSRYGRALKQRRSQTEAESMKILQHELPHVLPEVFIRQLLHLIEVVGDLLSVSSVEHSVEEHGDLLLIFFSSQLIANRPEDMELIQQMAEIRQIFIVAEFVESRNDGSLLICNDGAGKLTSLLPEHPKKG